ncbi:MAG TPA: phosphomannomutase/phosphoglucomutase [Acidimicrobiales bacterium]|nr:phosphomannomutase/phosphoglucomutase [Acidimicrobiales bacterium]
MDTTTIFKAYDVRGTYPDQIDERVAEAVGSAFATFAKSPRIVIARDMRTSGVTLSEAFARGVRAVGVEVVDLGLGSTDFLYFASGYLDVPGTMFTASHNPAKYNGIKLCLAGAKPVGVETGLVEIEALTNDFYEVPPKGDLADYSTLDLTAEWVAHVHSFADVNSFRPLKIVADTANGMGGFVAPLVFAGLPFEVEILFPELDGSFPNHPADPLNPDNLKDLQRRVLETGADVGLAFDGDADRVFLIDEKAQPVSGSTTTAMVAAVMLDRHPGSTVLYNLICSKSVPEVIAEEGGVAVRTRVGHSYIKQVMAETGAVFGGEHSGHYYYRDNFRADSGIITAFVVLELMSRATVPLSELAMPFQRYAASGEINTEVSDPASSVERLVKKLQADGVDVDLLDGLTADYGSWWFNLRPSNTEPLLRLNVEAADDESCQAHVDEVLTLIKETS